MSRAQEVPSGAIMDLWAAAASTRTRICFDWPCRGLETRDSLLALSVSPRDVLDRLLRDKPLRPAMLNPILTHGIPCAAPQTMVICLTSGDCADMPCHLPPCNARSLLSRR